MNGIKPRSLALRPVALLAAVAIALGCLGLQAGLASADPGDVKNIQQTAAAIQGKAFGAGAFAGPASTYDQAQVHQFNIQVIAGDDATKANSTQTASNEANIEQTDTAISGDATATDGGIARSGSARAGSTAIVIQLNIQVIAGVGCTVTQTASNVANVDQLADAVSGNATATGGGSASSGNASARNFAVVQQRNIQIYHCRGSIGSQTAANVANLDQTSGAASGNASAADGGLALTGNAAADTTVWLKQHNIQLTLD